MGYYDRTADDDDPKICVGTYTPWLSYSFLSISSVYLLPQRYYIFVIQAILFIKYIYLPSPSVSMSHDMRA